MTEPFEGLAKALRAHVTGEVRFDAGTRALYATAGGNYRQIPIGVVLPRTEEDILSTIMLCREHGAPVLSRGGGTSLAGQTCNIAVVLDMSKFYNRIRLLEPDARQAVVEPGLVLDELRNAAEKHHLTFGPDPATHTHCTLGGMIGNNSCGVHSVMAGKTVDNVIELDVVTYDGVRLRVKETSDAELTRIIAAGGRQGEIYAGLKDLRDRYADLIRSRYPAIPRRVSGYNLDELLPERGFHVARALVGTEGTCVTILSAVVRLVESPRGRSLLVLGYPDVYSAGDHIMEVLAHDPIALEGIDDKLIDDMKDKGLHPEDIVLLPEGKGWLLVEFGGADRNESDGKAHALMDALRRAGNPPTMKLFDDRVHERMVWKIRESGLGATANVPGKPLTWEGWEDAAVPPERVGAYLRDFRKLLDRYQYGCDLYGHFGQGCIHTRIDFHLESADGIRRYRAFIDEAADLVVRYGGSLSGEHGDGQSRAALLPKMFGAELVDAFRQFKRLWDPEGKMNPHKVVDPYDPTDNLRLGTSYDPWNPATVFAFPEDGHSLARATLRCVGVGECRRHEGGTMCPSYMATREELHSTRGRARLLFELMQREVVGKDGWRDEAVKSSLDLCLACKGCKSDCPVNVDMATYKAEFLAHYYHGRLRPRSAYAFGLIHSWAMLASHAPRAVNAVTGGRLSGRLARWIAGVDPTRRIPAFAPETFRAWFGKRSRQVDAPVTRVILWPDTFMNFFRPETGKAAVQVLEHAGCEVAIPPRDLCCGRPLYDWGMLQTARRRLHTVLEVLRPDIRAGVPIVGLEPSCVAVFRDELTNLFPQSEDAKRLSTQVFTLSEFLRQKAPHFDPPPLRRKALVHMHCHHKAIMKTGDEEEILRRTEVDWSAPELGCCGMAGAFGFERGERANVSRAVGERALLPAIRSASGEVLIVADGFSCREQIEQTTGKKTLHLSELLLLGLQGNGERGVVNRDSAS